MKVSVIITNYNYGLYLREAVESVKNQTYPDIEIIIVDDASADPFTLQVLSELEAEGYRLIRHTENKGVAAARNTGIAASGGEVILPLDADDRIHPEYTERAVAAMKQNDGPVVVYCMADLFGAENKPWLLPEYYDGVFAVHNVVFSSAFFYKKQWEAAGGYKSELHYWEDYEFWVSLAELGCRFIRLPETLFFYRRGHNSRDVFGDADTSVKYRDVFRFHKEYLLEHIDKIKYNTLTELYLVDTGGNLRNWKTESRCWKAGEFRITFDLTGSGEISDLRWDPLEGAGLELRLDSVTAEDQSGSKIIPDPAAFVHNGKILPDGTLRFITLDPWIYTGLKGRFQKITFAGKWNMIPANDVSEELIRENIRLHRELNSLKSNPSFIKETLLKIINKINSRIQ